jgi:alkylhydroperoxidase family enzyme
MSADRNDCRIPLLDIQAASDAATQVGIDPKYLTQPIWLALLKRPKYAKALYAVLTDLLFRNSMPVRLRELLIMRIGWKTAAEFEWAQHWYVSERAEVDPADILGVRDWRSSDRFDEGDRAALQAADEVCSNGVISEGTWQSLTEHFSEAERLELVAVLTTWYSVSILVRTLRIPLDEGMQSWPPDGRSPGTGTTE